MAHAYNILYMLQVLYISYSWTAMTEHDPEEKKCASALAEAWEKVTSIRRKAQKLKAVRAWEVVRSTLANPCIYETSGV